ncbi:MAG: efflux RND transporter periplasmic adaptor subunit [Candidatus Hydrogenedentes bacterium]|nr:efflux RND transporter periplasmic adaptor subunit [Candidatus Hydrogenedentota bacterium]
MSHPIHRPGQPPAAGRFSGCITLFLLMAALAGGLAAGARWHESIAGWLGFHATGTPTAGAPTGESGGQLWTCSMHPQVIQTEPGACPICHMQLVPLRGTKGENHTSGALEIDPAMVQNMGVRTAVIGRGPLYREIRAAGYLREAEPNVNDVSLRVMGWIEKLYANTEGMYVKAGDPLFELYSPEIYQALSELISLKNRDGHGEALANTSARRLELWGLTTAQITEYASRSEAPRTVTILSKAEGHVLEKMVSEGAGVEAGMTLFKIVDHDLLWMDIALFEMDLPYIALGQTVRATVESIPGDAATGVIDFIYPHVNMENRTTSARVAINNPGMRLRPGMYATARLDVILGEDTLLAPREAIINTGARQIAFVDGGGGHFQLKELELGNQGSDGFVEVVTGLAEGDSVVTSGQFLLDTESRLREAVQKFLTKEPAAKTVDDRSAPPLEGEMAPEATDTSPETDALYTEYLKLSALLGAPPSGDTPLDLAPLIAAAETLSANEAHPAKKVAIAILDAARPMAGLPLEEQRKAFGPLSDALIALSGQFAPSGAVTPNLFIIHCPMADRSWIQPGDAVANPYYRDEMKQCGTVVREVPAMAEAAKS